jgi:GAF domain-containing protein
MVTESAGLYEALVGFAHTLTRGYDISDVLHDLTSRIPSVLDIYGAGVSLCDANTTRFVTADNEAVAFLERVQQESQNGPGTAAIQANEPVLVQQLAEQADCWPDYVARAAELGIVSVAAIPMSNSIRIGALDLYDKRLHEWTDDEVSIARVFTDIASSYVLNASELKRQRRTAEQLQQALDSRVIIEQAKGIISADRNISIDQAFNVLRKHASDRNATLRAVAEAVVKLGLRP